MDEPGRVCPVRYRYGPAAIANAAEWSTETLYVVGGLYGNLQALDAVEVMLAAESGPRRLCFNGDFNWFNVDDAGFRAINERVLLHDAIVGNVEAELGEPSAEAGCGCAYPESVDQGVVERSNQIHALLKRTAARHPDLLARISSLPMVARYLVGGIRIGVVHGDAESLAGWRFDVTALDDPREHGWRGEVFASAGVDVFASSHTCLPAIRSFDIRGIKLIANNGAAGMPNAHGKNFGILTRIGTRPSPHHTLYGHKIGGVSVDALPIGYDAARWQSEFLKNWPAGSPAWQSYFKRIAEGPEYQLQRSV
jgi:hypothetical protein